MKRIKLLLPLALAAATTTFAANVGPNFEEIHELLRKNLAGISDTELEQAAIQGLIKQLYPLVSVVTNAGAATNSTPLANTSVLEGAYGYFRFNQVGHDADKEFTAALKRIAATNRLKGLVLDLRFTEGDNYAAAAALADPFLPAGQAMIDWGEGLKHSSGKAAPSPDSQPSTLNTQLPIAVLINSQTRGAAEAFAGILRRSDIGLLIGDNSAGQAYLTRDFTLKGPDRKIVRIATTPVKIASGPQAGGRAEPIDRKGLTPDIKVQVPLAEERLFIQDAYRPLPRLSGVGSGASTSANNGTNQTAGAGTNRTSRRRLNEAELVRMQREGIDLDSEFIPGRDAGPLRPPVITDPALARAVDLLKGLSVVNRRTF